MPEKYNLLILDDEEYILNALKRNFTLENYCVFTTTSYLEALEIIKNQQIAVCISDYRMPEIDGIEFLEKVKTFSPLTTRIILTGSQDIYSVLDLVKSQDINYFIPKPWEDLSFKFSIFSATLLYILNKDKSQLQKIEMLQKEILNKIKRLKIKFPLVKEKDIMIDSSLDRFLSAHLSLLKERV